MESPDTTTTQSRKKEKKERKTQRTDFYQISFRICRDVFNSIHAISQGKLTALVTHYKVAGVEDRVHRNKRKRPVNALKVDDYRAVVNFVVNYAEANASKMRRCHLSSIRKDWMPSDSAVCTTRSAPSLQIAARTSPHLALLLPSRSRSRVKPRCRTAMTTFHHHLRSQLGLVEVEVEDVEAKKSKQTALFTARHNSSFQN